MAPASILKPEKAEVLLAVAVIDINPVPDEISPLTIYIPRCAPVETPSSVIAPVPEVLKTVPVKSIVIPSPAVVSVGLPRPYKAILPPAALSGPSK